jgi:hypothetical protein
MNGRVPWNAALPRTFIEATRTKEIRALLKFGRDSNWPLKITLAFTLDEISSISITYSTDWTDCSGKTDWFVDKFKEAAYRDGLAELPVWTRDGIAWLAVLRKENNSIRVVLNEKRADGIFVLTPEDPGIPPYLLYGLNVELKLRCQNETILGQYLQALYAPSVACTEKVTSTEWAMIGALNDGIIPIQHRLIRDESVQVPAAAWNSQIYEAGLKTQNHDKGFERFVRKFNPELATEAVLSIVKGAHHEHGTAILFTQEKRWCLLLDTVHGLSDEEALWYTLASWEKFQPRLKRPRTEPGQLFYPAAYSHVFEKYWDHLDDPKSHPEWSQESDFIQECMAQYSAAMGQMNTEDFTPLVDPETKQRRLIIAQEAAVSRLCPIQDAYDFWNLNGGRSSQVTASGGPAPV